VAQWNRGKRQEFQDRKNYLMPKTKKQGHEVAIKPALREEK
jgi:hypothetical protein